MIIKGTGGTATIGGVTIPISRWSAKLGPEYNGDEHVIDCRLTYVSSTLCRSGLRDWYPPDGLKAFRPEVN